MPLLHFDVAITDLKADEVVSGWAGLVTATSGLESDEVISGSAGLVTATSDLEGAV